MRAAQRPAPQGWPRGDGDGPLADGHAPVECGAHRVPPERRQRHAARVEPAGRGGTNGVALARSASVRVTMEVAAASLETAMADGSRRVVPGVYTMSAGGHQPGDPEGMRVAAERACPCQ